MLFNISNHPSAMWDEAQTTEAIARWGGIEDIPFPQIDPLATTEQVIELAEQLCSHYIAVAEGLTNVAFHLMGEQTFCYHAVRILKQRGATVVAATSIRDTIEECGTKISAFHFSTFREY